MVGGVIHVYVECSLTNIVELSLTLTANSIKRKAVLLHSSVFKRISVHCFFHSRAVIHGKQSEIRGRRPICHGLTTPLATSAIYSDLQGQR